MDDPGEARFRQPSWLDNDRLFDAVDGRYLVMADTSKRREAIGGPFAFQLVSVTVASDGRTT